MLVGGLVEPLGVLGFSAGPVDAGRDTTDVQPRCGTAFDGTGACTRQEGVEPERKSASLPRFGGAGFEKAMLFERSGVGIRVSSRRKRRTL